MDDTGGLILECECYSLPDPAVPQTSSFHSRTAIVSAKRKRHVLEPIDSSQDSNIPYPRPPPSVELRNGVLYSGCQCVKRDGLQHDCPRRGCQGQASCMAFPAPMCQPSGNAPPTTAKTPLEHSAESNSNLRDSTERVNRTGSSYNQYVKIGRQGYVDNPPAKQRKIPCREHRKARV